MTSLPSQTTSSDPLPEHQLRGAVRTLTLGLTASTCIVIYIAALAHIRLLMSMEALLLWTALAAFLHSLYLNSVQSSIKSAQPQPLYLTGYRDVGQWVILACGLIVIYRFTITGLRFPLEPASMPVATLRFCATILVGLAAALYFIAHYAQALQNQVGSRAISPLVNLTRVAAISCALSGGLLFLNPFMGSDWTSALGLFFALLTVVLALEPWARLALSYYQPASQRSSPSSVGDSLILKIIFDPSDGLIHVIKHADQLFGVKLADLWIIRFLRESSEIVIVSALLLGWISTCLTIVPLGHRGVLISLGRYSDSVLTPGLHLSWPYPLGGIGIVDTEKVREISLGFEKDLSGAQLWTERHYAGEQNLLVGDGETLLTINVPIFYRISQATTYLQATPDPESALKSIAQRKLVQLAGSRDSFHLMTDERMQIAQQLKTDLQAEVDRLGFGIEIVFVGLKDIHPPVEVAPSYEQVVSAEEEKQAAIDQAQAYQVSLLPEANALARRQGLEADASALARIDQATGQASLFNSLYLAQRENPFLFRQRLRYEALDETLTLPAKILVSQSSTGKADYYMDLRSDKSSTAPPEIPQSQQPSPVRQTPVEKPER